MPSSKKKDAAVENPRNMKRPISDLSTMIFGLALSIGALGLINTVETSTSVVLSSIFTFAYSFAIIIFVWIRYTKMLEIVKVESGIEINLNLLLLFLVAIEPYLFNLLNNSSAKLLNFNSGLFAIDLGLMLVVMGVLYASAIRARRDLTKDLFGSYTVSGSGLFVSGLIFIISILPIFWNVVIDGTNLRFILWGLALIVGILIRRGAAKKLTK